jgi:hypothetical protein
MFQRLKRFDRLEVAFYLGFDGLVVDVVVGLKARL